MRVYGGFALLLCLGALSNKLDGEDFSIGPNCADRLAGLDRQFPDHDYAFSRIFGYRFVRDLRFA
jgi:hypothetical protein